MCQSGMRKRNSIIWNKTIPKLRAATVQSFEHQTATHSSSQFKAKLKRSSLQEQDNAKHTHKHATQILY